jgi:RHS repeat-associated protein
MDMMDPILCSLAQRLTFWRDSTGKERDAETELDYFLARYYSGAQGRFLSPDIIAGRLTNPQSLNKYTYVMNNPLIATDPTGMTVN